MFKHILLSSILVNNRVIIIENTQKNFQVQLPTFENVQLQLQQNRVINYNFVNYNYNFSKPDPNVGLYQFIPNIATLQLRRHFSKTILGLVELSMPGVQNLRPRL